jgi:hypothetical protein
MDLSYVIPVVCRRWFSVSLRRGRRASHTECLLRTTQKSSSVPVPSTWATWVSTLISSWFPGPVCEFKFALTCGSPFFFASVRMHHLGVPHCQAYYGNQHELLFDYHHRCHGSLWCLVRARRTTSLPRPQAKLGRDSRTSYREQHAPANQGRGEQRKRRDATGRLDESGRCHVRTRTQHSSLFLESCKLPSTIDCRGFLPRGTTKTGSSTPAGSISDRYRSRRTRRL